jgi:hypothetical protein
MLHVRLPHGLYRMFMSTISYLHRFWCAEGTGSSHRLDIAPNALTLALEFIRKMASGAKDGRKESLATRLKVGFTIYFQRSTSPDSSWFRTAKDSVIYINAGTYHKKPEFYATRWTWNRIRQPTTTIFTQSWPSTRQNLQSERRSFALLLGQYYWLTEPNPRLHCWDQTNSKILGNRNTGQLSRCHDMFWCAPRFPIFARTSAKLPNWRQQDHKSGYRLFWNDHIDILQRDRA